MVYRPGKARLRQAWPLTPLRRGRFGIGYRFAFDRLENWFESIGRPSLHSG
jgi:hypothetical protein